MRFAVVVFAVLAVAYAQNTPTPKPSAFNTFGFPQNNQYNPYGQYNRYQKYSQGQYQPYNQYQNQYQGQYQNRYPYQTYKPVVTSTVAPLRPVEPVAPSAAPSPAPVATASATVSASPAPAPVRAVISSKVVSDARAASVVKYGNEINPDGAFNYFFETDNGIAAQAQGVPRNFGGDPPVSPDVVQGSFSWISPEGEEIALTYTADENGYQAQGSAIPQPPEIPPQIARALEYIAKYTPVQK
ncbi:unnamed protein product, partial [Iphiclides podalirius]